MMTTIPLNHLVRLVAWNQHDDPRSEFKVGSFGTCLTVWNDSVDVKLMPIADAEFLSRTIPPFDPNNQFFTLVPASGGGFRIVSPSTQRCFDYGDWFYNDAAGLSRTAVRHLVLRPIDQLSPSQIFYADKPPNYQNKVDSYVFHCKIGDKEFALYFGDHPSKSWVELRLIIYNKTNNNTDPHLLAVLGTPLVNGARGIRVHNTGAFIMNFEIEFSRLNTRGRNRCPEQDGSGKQSKLPAFSVGQSRTIDLAGSQHGNFNPSPFEAPIEMFPVAQISGGIEDDGSSSGEHRAGHNVVFDPASNLYALYDCGGTIFQASFDFKGFTSDPA